MIFFFIVKHCYLILYGGKKKWFFIFCIYSSEFKQVLLGSTLLSFDQLQKYFKCFASSCENPFTLKYFSFWRYNYYFNVNLKVNKLKFLCVSWNLAISKFLKRNVCSCYWTYFKTNGGKIMWQSLLQYRLYCMSVPHYFQGIQEQKILQNCELCDTEENRNLKFGDYF